jgi:hypothetical protein
MVPEVQAGQRVVLGDKSEVAERALDYRVSSVHTQ